MINEFKESLRRRIETLLETLESRRWLLLLLFTVLFFAGFCLIASRGVITNDELFTVYIGRLPAFRDVWAALATGAEQTPPFFYILTRADFALFGTANLAIRLPELLGSWVMCVCLFDFVSRRSSASYGFIAMLLPLMTSAFSFVAWARAYVLVLGFSALALLCWQRATENRRRTLALVGMAVSLAAAISCHYYAVLSLFPLGLGEVVRTIRRKRIDVGVWLVLVLSLSPLLLFLPLIHAAQKFAPHFWSKPYWTSMLYFYQHFLLPPAVLPLLAILLVVITYAALRPTQAGTEARRVRSSLPSHEIAAALGFLLVPVVGVVLAKTAVGAFAPRYALSAVIGLSIIVAWGLYILLDGRRSVALALGLLLCGFLVAKQVQTYRRAVEERSEQASTYAFLEAHAKGNAPIVISDPVAFTMLTYKAPRDIEQRLLYLADPQLGIRYTGTDDIEQGLVEMKRWAGLNVEPYHTFVSSGQQCYVLFLTSYYPYDYEWIIPALRAAHWRIKLLTWRDGKILFSASPGLTSSALSGGK
ncbi:MAG: glycosyltransferase family 39 protein [Acidobacteriota bacterium]